MCTSAVRPASERRPIAADRTRPEAARRVGSVDAARRARETRRATATFGVVLGNRWRRRHEEVVRRMRERVDDYDDFAVVVDPRTLSRTDVVRYRSRPVSSDTAGDTKASEREDPARAGQAVRATYGSIANGFGVRPGAATRRPCLHRPPASEDDDRDGEAAATSKSARGPIGVRSAMFERGPRRPTGAARSSPMPRCPGPSIVATPEPPPEPSTRCRRAWNRSDRVHAKRDGAVVGARGPRHRRAAAPFAEPAPGGPCPGLPSASQTPGCGPRPRRFISGPWRRSKSEAWEAWPQMHAGGAHPLALVPVRWGSIDHPVLKGLNGRSGRSAKSAPYSPKTSTR